jgi:hypothetical protein
MTKALPLPSSKTSRRVVRTAQVRAALAVNRELIQLYWSIRPALL